MSLWICSQDKEKLVKSDRIQIDFEYIMELKHNVISIINLDNSNNFTILGVYSTKEKALKVLDMIQTRICSIKKLELIGNILNVSSPSEIAFNEEDKFVFQMPQDSEVE